MSTPVNSNTFRHFPDLPIELRLAIWELYILSSGSQGRVVNVQIKRTVSLKSNTIQKGNSALDDKETISTWAASTLSTHDEGLATNALRVCRESRKAFMERNPDMIGMVSGTKVHFDHTIDTIYLSDFDLFQYYLILQRRRPATHPIRGLENISKLQIDVTPTGLARANRMMLLWNAVMADYDHQKAVMIAGMSMEERMANMGFYDETEKEKNRLTGETTNFLKWKKQRFMAKMVKLGVQVSEL